MTKASGVLVQVELQSGTSRRTCWLEPRIRVGNEVTLKNSEEPTRRWKVLSVGDAAPRESIHTDWHNNI